MKLNQLVITKTELSVKQGIRSYLKQSEPNMDEEDESFKIATVLLLLANYGHRDIEKLVRLSGYEHEFVTKTLQDIAINGLYKNGKVNHSGWFDKQCGGLLFWLDVAVIRGWLERCPANENKCRKCGHKWVQRGKTAPKVCPTCKTEKWNLK